MPLILTYLTAYPILTLTSPYLPLLIRDLGYPPEIVGLFLGVFEVAGMAGPFIIGRFVDRIGRTRPGLVLAYALLLASLIPLIYIHHPAVVLISLIALSMGARSMVPITDTAATIVLGPKGNYGRYRWIGSFSFVVVSLFLQYQPWVPLTSAASIAFWLAVTTVFAFCFIPALPERDPRDRNFPSGAAPHRGKMGARKFIDGPFVLGIVIIALSRLAMSPINGFFSIYLVEELHWNVVALMSAVAASLEIPVMFFSARLITRFGPPLLLAVSSFAVLVRLLLYALFPNPAGVVAAQLLNALCYGLFHPAAVSFIATRVPPERRATGMAIYLSLGSALPSFIGNSLGGFYLAAVGYRVMFASYGIFAVASIVLYFLYRKVLDAPTRAW